ncbi:hypothetical protein FVE85_5641 [Porphyridium purpureum]|uniref:Uncharacterized protein n=1 Tax=Porphyridium purpureum TaxID=35688 RepID=A0A5J4Z372_PORPP|nr:hypothetical protein FVE85_5641 [Porphyridium purpureum]|eukprot:POR6160..scf295_1
MLKHWLRRRSEILSHVAAGVGWRSFTAGVKMEQPVIKFFMSPYCPYAARAHVALEEVGLVYEIERVGLKTYGEEKPAWYPELCAKSLPIRSSQVGPVPGLQVGIDAPLVLGSRTVVMLIMDLAAALGKKSLLVGDHLQKAKVRNLMDEMEKLYSAANVLLANKEPGKDAALTVALRNQVDDINAMLDAFNSAQNEYIFPEFSVADVFMIPFLDRMRFVLPQLRGVDVMAMGPHFKRLLRAYETRDSFKVVSQGERVYMQGFSFKAYREPPAPLEPVLEPLLLTTSSPKICILQKVKSAAEVDTVLRELQPRSWISLLTSSESADPNLAFIGEQVERYQGGEEEHHRDIFYSHIPFDSEKLGSKIEHDADLAGRLADAIHFAPKPVVIQCASGRRASVAFSVSKALVDGERNYETLRADAEIHKFTWPASEKLAAFVRDTVLSGAAHAECC